MAPQPSSQELDRALVEEAARKSGLLWVTGTDGVTTGLWHVWQDGAAVLVGGPGEQPLRGLPDGGTVRVTLRSKDKGGRLVVWEAAVRELAPRSPDWSAAVEELKGKRLNAPDFARIPERWADTCRVLRLVPGAVLETPADPGDGSGAAAPVSSPATTRRPAPAALPRLLLRRRKRA